MVVKMQNYFQVECSPMCKIEWLIGEDLVLQDNVEYMIEEEEVEEDKDKNHFSYVTSTLIWLQLDSTFNNFSATCRSNETIYFSQNVFIIAI